MDRVAPMICTARLHPRGPLGSYPPMWIVYMLPSDMPTRLYTVRLWYGDNPTSEHECFDQLAQARDRIREVGGSYCIGRQPRDPPTVVEAWV